jgi:hypothetical protein
MTVLGVAVYNAPPPLAVSAALTVYGNVTVVDAAGSTNDLLAVIKQQQLLLQKQTVQMQTMSTQIERYAQQLCNQNSSMSRTLQSLPDQLQPIVSTQHVFTPSSSYANGFTGTVLYCPSGSIMLGCLVNCGNAVGTSQVLASDSSGRPIGCSALCETGNRVDQNIWITCLAPPQPIQLQSAVEGACGI